MADGKKKVLVTGAKGMLGHRVVASSPPEWEVTGADLEEFDITSLEETLSFVQALGCPNAAQKQPGNEACESDKQMACHSAQRGAESSHL